MLELSINPFLRIGSIEVRWIVLTTILAFLLALIMVILEARRYGQRSATTIIGLCLAIMAGSIIGGRLFYILNNWPSLIADPVQAILSPWILMYGVIIGAVAGIALHATINRICFWQTADMVTPGAALGLTVYRIGCIINGCCYGVATSLPWAVVYTDPECLAPFGKLLHPTQLYHFIAGLLGFMAIWLLRKKLKPQGSLFLLAMALLAATDLPIRLFRAEDSLILGLQQAQIMGVVILLITVPWLIARMRSGNRQAKDNPEN